MTVDLNWAKGIDVSKWNPVSDWQAIKNSGVSFIGVKATEGNTIVDRNLKSTQRDCRSTGFDLVIYYHFALIGSATSQANRFMDAVGALNANERLALDFERLATPDDNLLWIDDFMSAIADRYADRRHIIYTSQRIWRMIGEPAWERALTVDLWSPRYNSEGNEPELPSPWRGKGWTFWQWSDGNFPLTQTPGVGKCDANYFHGTKTDLINYAKLLPAVT